MSHVLGMPSLIFCEMNNLHMGPCYQRAVPYHKFDTTLAIIDRLSAEI